MATFGPSPCRGISGVVLDDRSLLKTSRVSFVRVGKRTQVFNNVFSDNSHLGYYVKGEAKEMKMKKKLVKRLSKDLDFLSRYGGETKGLELVGEVKRNMISDAADVLLAEVRELKAAVQEEKRRRKAEKARQKALRGEDSSSESSSSESSDDDCNRNIVDLRACKNNLALEKPAEAERVVEIANDVVLPMISHQTQVENTIGEINGIPVESTAGKIEVCMGGKCKKMGSMSLMEEFERKVGVEGAVMGCKCMGKCKNAPNVRVTKSADVVESIGGGDSSVTSPTNPLFLGVCLNDVDMIVSHFEGKDSPQMTSTCT